MSKIYRELKEYQRENSRKASKRYYNKHKKKYHQKYSCLICKELNEKDHKRGLVGKYLLSSMIWFDTEEEAIEHIKNKHPKIYNKINKEPKNKKSGGKKR